MMAVNIANELADIGVQSHICTTRLEGSLKSKIAISVGYLFLNKTHTLDLRALKKLSKYIKENRIDIIHAHSSSYFFAFLIKIRTPKIKIIWHNHYGNIINSPIIKILVLKIVSYYFDHVISVNEILDKWTQFNLKTNKNSYLVNFALFDFNITNYTILHGELNKRIVCIANLREDKDHINLLKAFEKVLQKYPKWTLHLVGMDLNDKYSKKIKSFIKMNNLVNSVFLYGSCSDIAYILEQATIGVLASKSEGLPVSLLEYGLAKLPVVVTNVGDCNKVVQNNVNGLLIEPANEKNLADAILKLITNNELRMNFGTNLYKNIQHNFSKESYISKLIKIYH